MKNMNGGWDMPLTGVRVLDLTRLLPFGYGSMMLGDMGAEVIKIEEPGKGDYMRWIPPIKGKESHIFLSVNRNKKSMTLDLRKEDGKEVFFRLVQTADVLFESFRPGVVKKLGIDYESVRKVNPGLIYCSCTGYGQSGPYHQRPGHDINYLGVSGVLGVTGRHHGAPVVPGVPVADMTAGVFCAFAICGALVGRNRSNEGRYIDISMTDCMVSYMHAYASVLFGANESAVPISGSHGRYGAFEAKDGRFITLGNVEDKFWCNFCDLVGREDLKKYPFTGGQERDDMVKHIQELIRTRTRDEWISLLEGEDVCFGSVNELDEVFKDAQIMHRGMYFEINHPVEGKIGQIACPVKFKGIEECPRSPAPLLGEHTIEVLQELGYSSQKIRAMKSSSII